MFKLLLLGRETKVRPYMVCESIRHVASVGGVTCDESSSAESMID